MKKIIALLLAAVLCASVLCSCGEDNNNESSGKAAETTVGKDENNSSTSDEADADVDLAKLHGVSDAPENDFGGAWKITDGEGKQYKSFVYMFDGTTKSVLMTGTVGQIAVYGVEDETDDNGKTETYFKSNMMFGINGKYTFKFSDDKKTVVLTNAEDKSKTTLEKLSDYEYIPKPEDKPAVDDKLSGAWKGDDGEMLYFDKSGIMYEVMPGMNFYFATYTADGKKVSWSYSYTSKKLKEEKADYSINGDSLTFNKVTYQRISASELQ